MNLHEECLLKYLSNPLNLNYTTELLKLNNALIEEKINKKGFIVKALSKTNYSLARS